MVTKVLIANRGEIALRIHRACREMGIQTVAVHSTADSDAMHVRLADEAYPLPGSSARETYLDQEKIFDVAARSHADAIHRITNEPASNRPTKTVRAMTFIRRPSLHPRRKSRAISL